MRKTKAIAETAVFRLMAKEPFFSMAQLMKTTLYIS